MTKKRLFLPLTKVITDICPLDAQHICVPTLPAVSLVSRSSWSAGDWPTSSSVLRTPLTVQPHVLYTVHPVYCTQSPPNHCNKNRNVFIIKMPFSLNIFLVDCTADDLHKLQ